jgi:hypothetical protein
LAVRGGTRVPRRDCPPRRARYLRSRGGPLWSAQWVTLSAGADAGIGPALSSVPEDRLVWQVCTAELVVLRYTHRMDSGALPPALSCSRPAVVHATPAHQALAVEVAARARSWSAPDLTTQETMARSLSRRVACLSRAVGRLSAAERRSR